MQRGERDQLAQLVEDLRRDDGGRRESRPAMNDAVSDAEHPRAAVAGAQPGGERVERRAPVAARVLSSALVGEDLTRTILGGEARRRPDPFDLPARLESPCLATGPPVDAELQARGSGVEDDGIVGHAY